MMLRYSAQVFRISKILLVQEYYYGNIDQTCTKNIEPYLIEFTIVCTISGMMGRTSSGLEK